VSRDCPHLLASLQQPLRNSPPNVTESTRDHVHLGDYFTRNSDQDTRFFIKDAQVDLAAVNWNQAQTGYAQSRRIPTRTIAPLQPAD
jgi:hypothetical protein